MAARPPSKNTRPHQNFLQLNNLCARRNGACILFATDDWFAPAEDLLKETEPEWKEGVFTQFGKWMDGWETRRKRIPGHDWCVIQLAYPGIIHGIDVDTSFYTGNYTPKISLQAANFKSLPESFQYLRTSVGATAAGKEQGEGVAGRAATEEEFQNIQLLKSEEWTTLVPTMTLGSGYADTCHNYITTDNRDTWTHVRLNMFPDGGIARLRIYGQVQRPLDEVVHAGAESDLIDLVAMENGGICLGYSDAHYGHPKNMILKEEPLNMEQSWETARRLDRPEVLTTDSNGILQVPGHEWAVFRLGVLGYVHRIQVDTTFFKGNFPDSCSLQAILLSSDKDKNLRANQLEDLPWQVLLEPKKLGPNQKHFFENSSLSSSPVTHVRIIMAPDGGIARLRLWGKPAAAAAASL